MSTPTAIQPPGAAPTGGVQGYYYPRTRQGGASLLPGPPWFYSGDLLTVEYRTDPARVAELLPSPLTLAEDDPGAVALIWADWQSCSTTREELLDPVRAQYKEAFVAVRFAMARGIVQGYPKKLGSMWQTRPHPFSHAAPQLAAGGVFGATLAACDRRLAQAVLTLQEESPMNGFVNGHPMAHHRVLPGIARGSGDAFAELIASGAAAAAGGQAWRGDVDLQLFASPTEELARLRVDEVIGGYYRQVRVCVGTAGVAGAARFGHPLTATTTTRTFGLKRTEGAAVAHAVVAGVEVATEHWIGGERVASRAVLH